MSSICIISSKSSSSSKNLTNRFRIVIRIAFSSSRNSRGRFCRSGLPNGTVMARFSIPGRKSGMQRTLCASSIPRNLKSSKLGKRGASTSLFSSTRIPKSNHSTRWGNRITSTSRRIRPWRSLSLPTKYLMNSLPTPPSFQTSARKNKSWSNKTSLNI